MIENPSLTAPEDTEDFQDPEIELPLPVIVALQERDARRQNCEEEFPGAASFPVSGKGADVRRSKVGNRDEDISLSHHAARCSICQHPDRDAIEQGYLHWESPTLLAYEYGLGQRRAVYRHVRAFGLREKRAARTRRSLEFIMEQAETVTASADSVIRAVRAYSCLDEDGRWTEPTKRVIITHEHIDRSEPDAGRVCPPRHASSQQVGRASSVQTGHASSVPTDGYADVEHSVRLSGDPNLNPAVLAKEDERCRPEPSLVYPACPEERGESMGERRATRHLPAVAGSSLATEVATLGDGHAVPSIFAVTPAPPTKVEKLMDTLSRASSALIGRASSALIESRFARSRQKEEESPAFRDSAWI